MKETAAQRARAERLQNIPAIKSMTIQNKNFDDFINVIDSLVKKGLTFDADSCTLEIKLLGGY
jgi:hypothetical protein